MVSSVYILVTIAKPVLVYTYSVVIIIMNIFMNTVVALPNVMKTSIHRLNILMAPLTKLFKV